MVKSGRSDELKSTSYELFIGTLSILSIVNLIWLYLSPIPQIEQVLRVMNAVLTFIFVIDFLMRLFTTDSKARYLWKEFGWADLLACLPLPQVKVFRLFRVFRAYRLTQKAGLGHMIRDFIADRAQSVLLTLLLTGILVFQFGSMAILRVESQSPEANIKTASDALWYTIVTISTVGYGDRYPVTNAGRIVGSVIIIVGVGLFGTFAGFLANWFLSPSKQQQEARPEPESPSDGTEKAEATEAEKS